MKNNKVKLQYTIVQNKVIYYTILSVVKTGKRNKLIHLSIIVFPETFLRSMSDVKLKIEKTDGDLKPHE